MSNGSNDSGTGILVTKEGNDKEQRPPDFPILRHSLFGRCFITGRRSADPPGNLDLEEDPGWDADGRRSRLLIAHAQSRSKVKRPIDLRFRWTRSNNQ